MPLSDLHMVVLSWIATHPDQTVDQIAAGLGADVEEVGRLCDDLHDAGYIETPLQRASRS